MQPKELQDLTVAQRDQYNKTLKASSRLDTDSGIELFLNLVKKDPALLPARERLRELEQRKLKNMSVVSVTIANLLSAFTVFFRINPIVSKNPAKAMQLCEDVLAECLNNRFALIALANAAAELDARFIGVEAVNNLRRFWTDDQAQIFSAEYLTQSGSPQEGARIYQEMIAADPNNGRLKTMLREALAVASMESDSTSTQTVQTRDSEEAIAQQLMDGTIHDAAQAQMLIEKYNSMLAEKESTDVRRRLAEAYLVAQKYDEAIASLNKVAELLGAFDPALDKSIEKATAAKYAAEIKAIESDPSAENAAERIAGLKKELDDYKLAKAEARVAAYPNDLQLHYDLALLYFAAGNNDAALEQFQSARNHPQRRVSCQYYIGRCLAVRGMTDMAIEQLEEAYKHTPASDRMHKEMLYYLALTLENAGRHEDALARYKALYQEDISFMDVEDRIKKLSQ